jgi:hypothetical protein
MQDAIYVEWVPAGKLMKALVGLTCLVFSAILFIVITVGTPAIHFLILILGPVIVFLLLLFWNFRGINIQLSGKELLVHYGIFNRKSIPVADVVSCEPTRTFFRKYGGVGVRMGIDGSIAYATCLDNAVRLNLRKGRLFVFSSNSPKELCGIIKGHQNIAPS